MKTEELIAALAADSRPAKRPVERGLLIALIIGGLLSIVIFAFAMGIRPDFVEAAATWRFQAKFTLVTLALVLALVDCLRLAGPIPTGLTSRTSLLIPLALLGAVSIELVSVPVEEWVVRAIGTNAVLCLFAIPLLATAPLVAGLLAMRSCAPASPALAGASAGRLAAALAAGLYSLNCFDDSPLFVATWYTLATVPVMALGGMIGAHALKW
jgi:hypothetical protein